MYIDAIIECPNGFAPALQELIGLGLEEYVKFDEDHNPIGLNKVNRFYPTVPTFDTPSLLYIRGFQNDIDTLMYEDDQETTRTFSNINILVIHPADSVEDIYEALQADLEATAIYQTYIYHPEFLDDGVTTNPKLQKTITVDIEDTPTEMNNPQYDPFKKLGYWA